MKTKIQLDGYEVEIDSMYSYSTYTGLFCGVIDTKMNNEEEEKAKERAKQFQKLQGLASKVSLLYLKPSRKRRLFSSFAKAYIEFLQEDYRSGVYNSSNFPECKLSEYWVILELYCWGTHKEHTTSMISGVYVVFNIKDLHIQTIEKYLYENLTMEIWDREATELEW